MTPDGPMHAPTRSGPTTLSRIVWTFGFLIGTATHTLDIINHGWLPYEFRPLPWNIYWTSLVFLDTLAAMLIWVRLRWGLFLGAAIMASNVSLNAYTAFVVGYPEFYFSLGAQSAFGAFVFWMAWRHWNNSNIQSLANER